MTLTQPIDNAKDYFINTALTTFKKSSLTSSTYTDDVEPEIVKEPNGLSSYS